MIRHILHSAIALSLGAVPALAQQPSATPDNRSANAPKEFDSFILVLLVRPANLPELAKEKREQLQEARLANIRRLASEGKVLKAGPVEDYSGRDVRGISFSIPNRRNRCRSG